MTEEFSLPTGKSAMPLTESSNGIQSLEQRARPATRPFPFPVSRVKLARFPHDALVTVTPRPVKHNLFLTNDFNQAVKTIAYYHHARWQREFFFKCIEQNFRIKSFWHPQECCADANPNYHVHLSFDGIDQIQQPYPPKPSADGRSFLAQLIRPSLSTFAKER